MLVALSAAVTLQLPWPLNSPSVTGTACLCLYVWLQQQTSAPCITGAGAPHGCGSHSAACGPLPARLAHKAMTEGCDQAATAGPFWLAKLL